MEPSILREKPHGAHASARSLRGVVTAAGPDGGKRPKGGGWALFPGRPSILDLRPEAGSRATTCIAGQARRYGNMFLKSISYCSISESWEGEGSVRGTDPPIPASVRKPA